jgi:membrane fusion protein, heavy metal efflux system
MNFKKWGFCFLTLAYLYTNPLLATASDGHDHTEIPAKTEHRNDLGQDKNNHDEHGDKDHDEHGDKDRDEHGDKDHDEHGDKDHDEHGDKDHDENASEEKHGDEGHDDHTDENGHKEEENSVNLSKVQIQSAGIVVQPINVRTIPMELEAPGEIKLNAYASSQVTPRIDAHVMKRHARLGDQVKAGQPLVTLTSAEMAEAQGELIITAKEWQRVKRLKNEVVSQKRYLESRVAFQKAYAQLLAYGMTSEQAEILVNEGDVSRADGSFSLLSPQNGIIINDDFVLGQMVEVGDKLFELTDESLLWAEIRIKPEQVGLLNIGAKARVQADNKWIDAKVIQIYHSLDEKTRTLAVRLEVPNPQDLLHPGQFVTARIQSSESSSNALTLPQNAVLRSPDGDWLVFVQEEPGEFEPREVELVRQLPDMAVITGIEPGTMVITKGAFFLQSELAKSGFDVHNH